MNWALFKTTFRANWTIGLIFTLIIMIYVTTSVGMYDPENSDAIASMLDLLPEGMVKAMGFDKLGTELTEYISNYLYGFIMLTFPMIYGAIMSNRLIAKHVDSGAMAYLLTTPNSRVRIATTQALYLAVSLAAIIAIDVAVAIVMSASMFPGMLDVGGFLAVNWVTYLAMLVTAGIGFLGSCIFSDTRYSLAVGAGIPVLFLVTRMLSGLGESVEWMKYLSIFSFIRIEQILDGSGYTLIATLILAPAVAVLFVTAIRIFDRRSLAL